MSGGDSTGQRGEGSGNASTREQQDNKRDKLTTPESQSEEVVLQIMSQSICRAESKTRDREEWQVQDPVPRTRGSVRRISQGRLRRRVAGSTLLDEQVKKPQSTELVLHPGVRMLEC